MTPCTSNAFGMTWRSPGVKFLFSQSPFAYGVGDAAFFARRLIGCEMEAMTVASATVVRHSPLQDGMFNSRFFSPTPIGQLRPVERHELQFVTSSGLSFVMQMVIAELKASISDPQYTILLKGYGCFPSRFDWPGRTLWHPELVALIQRHNDGGHDARHVVADWLEDHDMTNAARTVMEIDPWLTGPFLQEYAVATAKRELGWPGWEHHVSDWYASEARKKAADCATSQDSAHCRHGTQQTEQGVGEGGP